MSIALWIVGWRRVFFWMPQHLPELNAEFEMSFKKMICNCVKYKNLEAMKCSYKICNIKKLNDSDLLVAAASDCFLICSVECCCLLKYFQCPYELGMKVPYTRYRYLN